MHTARRGKIIHPRRPALQSFSLQSGALVSGIGDKKTSGAASTAGAPDHPVSRRMTFQRPPLHRAGKRRIGAPALAQTQAGATPW